MEICGLTDDRPALPGNRANVSIVLPAYNEGRRLCQTIAAIRETVAFSCEIIVVNDGSTDGCCDFLRGDPPPFENVILIDLAQRHGVAAARNLGAAKATSPILVAMDAHCQPRRGWLEHLLEELHKPDVGIVAPQISSVENPSVTTFGLTIRDVELGVEWLHRKSDKPYPIPLAGCACMAMTREVFQAIGGFEPMRSYGMEDVEICIRCWLLGYSVMMVPGAQVTHWFKKEPFPVNWHDFLYNRLRTAVLHFDGDRLERIINSLRSKPAFAEAITSLLTSDIWTRRQQIRAQRKHDADWFCQKFGITI